MPSDAPEPGADRPEGCAGCGLRAAVDPEEPADHETTFEVERETEDAVVFECGFCETRTRVSKDPDPAVDCRNCGESIPESLQGGHACESHPLGTAATPDFSNPMEGYR